MCYARMLARYKGRLDPNDEKYANNLFKRIYSNHLSDISNIAQKEPREPIDIDSPQGLATVSEPDVMMAVAEAPEPIKSVLKLVLDKPEVVLGLPCRLRLNGKRNKLSKRIRHMLGNIPGIDDNIMSRLRTYLEKGYDPAHNNYEEDRVRCWAQNPQPCQQMPERSRTPVCPGSDALRADNQLWKSGRNGVRLRNRKGNHDAKGRGAVGSRVPLLGRRHPDTQNVGGHS